METDPFLMTTAVKACTLHPKHILDQWFSTFLKMCTFNIVSHVVVTPNNKVIFVAITVILLLFSTLYKCLCFLRVLGDPCERAI